MDFKILPTSPIYVKLITNYIDTGSDKFVLKFKDVDNNDFNFGVSLDDIKYMNLPIFQSLLRKA